MAQVWIWRRVTLCSLSYSWFQDSALFNLQKIWQDENITSCSQSAKNQMWPSVGTRKDWSWLRSWFDLLCRVLFPSKPTLESGNDIELQRGKERRCLPQPVNAINATFIGVKWRQGQLQCSPAAHTWTDIWLNPTGVYLQYQVATRTPNVESFETSLPWYVCWLTPLTL